MAQGIDQPMPFKLRRGLPVLCRTSEFRWVTANVVSMVYAAAGIGILASQHGATIAQSGLASVLFLGLPWVRFCAGAPILVDMPALACAVLAAVLWPVSPFAALCFAFAGAYISERVPVWAAVFACSPFLLLALAIPLWNHFFWRDADVDPNEPLADTLLHPFKTGIEWHKDTWLDSTVMLLPWGMCLLAVLNPSWWLLLALVVGYAQLLVATDTVRLYQQAAPVVCISAAMAVPVELVWILPAIVGLHWFNPLKGDGV
jgi:hypothetical protein